MKPARQTVPTPARTQDEIAQLVDHIDIVAWELDPTSLAFTYVSQGAERLFGYPVSAWLGDREFWVQRIHPEDRAAAIAFSAAAIRDGRDHEFDYRFGTADGCYRWVRDVVRVTRDNDDAVVAIRGVLFDESSRRQAVNALADSEQRFRSLESRLQQSNKLEALGHLAGSVAHDFNNILAIIVGAAELAQLGFESEPDAIREDLQAIAAAAQRGKALTAQLLEFARRRPAIGTVVTPSVVIAELQHLLVRLAGPRITLSVSSHSTARVQIDETRFEQIVVNLVVNARDAIDGRGTVRIETHDEHVAAVESVDGTTLPHGRYVRVRVADSGRGIAPEVVDRIFEQFFTTKSHREGTGLGLATVLAAVKHANGGITLESGAQTGTRFDVWLPAA